MSSKDNDAIAIVAEGMEIFRAEMETIDRLSHKIGTKTTRIIRVVLTLLTVVSIYLVGLTITMGQDLAQMITSLDDMYIEFGSMSGDMRKITAHVQNMGANINGIPIIAENMQHLTSDVGNMLVSMETINRDMSIMDANIGHVGRGTSEMAYRFNNVQQVVDIMGNDIHTMLRPMDMMPR